MGGAPLLLPLAGIVAGILLASFLPGGLTWVGAIALIAGSVTFACRRYALGAVLFYLFLGYATAELHTPAPASRFGKCEILGETLSVVEATTSGRIAIVEVTEVDSLPVRPFKVRLHTLSERPYMTGGMVMRSSLTLNPLASPPEIPDIIDLSASLRRQGVVALGEVVREDMSVIGPAPGFLPWFRRANAELSLSLMECELSPQSIDMLLAMLLGNGHMLDPSSHEIYSAAGLAHLLALSGMHVGIIAMLISLALWPLYVGRHNRTRMLLTIVALWAYALLTGLSPSVTRAVIMTSVYLLGRILERPSASVNTLCLAAILILLFTPSDLFSVGFQLSFAAVAGILLFYPLINRVDLRNHPWLYRLVSYPALSLSAMVLTGIVSAYHFHSYPLLFLVSNLLVAPLVPLFVSAGALGLMLHLFGMDPHWLGACIDFLGAAIGWVADTTASVSFSHCEGIYFPSWFAVISVLSLLVLAAGIHMGRRTVAIVALMALCGGVGTLMALPPRQYPAEEVFVIEDYRHKHLIMRSGKECRLYSTNPVPGELDNLVQLYERMLADYLALRGVDSIAPRPGRTPLVVEGGETLMVALDSCTAPSRLFYLH